MELEDSILDYEENKIMDYAREHRLSLPEAEKRLYVNQRLFYNVLSTSQEERVTFRNLEEEGSVDNLADDIFAYFVEEFPKRLLVGLENGSKDSHQEAVDHIAPALKGLVNQRLEKFNQQHGAEFILEQINLKRNYALELRFNYKGNSQDTQKS